MKVYIVKINVVVDYEVCEDQLYLYANKEDAWKYYEHRRDALAKEAKDNGWEVEGDNSCSYEFSAYEFGYASVNHAYVTFCESELDIPSAHSWELQTDVETKAIDEIREMLGKTGENTWSFGADATGKYNGDIPYVMAHHVMQGDDFCEIGIEDICIDDDDNLIIGYHVVNVEEIGGERFEDNLITCVMPQYYQRVARALWQGVNE